MSDKRILELFKEFAAERMDGYVCPICKEDPLLKVICPYRLAGLWEEVAKMKAHQKKKRQKAKRRKGAQP